MDLDGKRALVTGGSSGIGLAIAQQLVARGCRVAVNGRDHARLDAAASSLGAVPLPGDVGVEAEARAVVGRCIESLGGLDVLINNAGFGTFASLLDTRPADVEAVWRTNVFGAFVVAQAAARHMVAQRSGAIVNIASTAALKGFPGGTAYAASKFALRGMNECWREELRRHDVRVMLVNPSEVLTDFAARAGHAQQASERKLRPEDIAHAVIAGLGMEARGFIPELAVFATNPF